MVKKRKEIVNPGMMMKISVTRIENTMKRLGIQNSQNNKNSRWQQWM